jgi:hypothetical protein
MRMPLTVGEELRIELQIATYSLIAALNAEEQALQTTETTRETRERLRQNVLAAQSRRDHVVKQFDQLATGW